MDTSGDEQKPAGKFVNALFENMYNHLHTSPVDCNSEGLLGWCKKSSHLWVLWHIYWDFIIIFLLLTFCFLDPVQVLATETELSDSEMETEVTVIEKPEKSYQGIHGVEENQSAKNSGKYVCYIETEMIQHFVVKYWPPY